MNHSVFGKKLSRTKNERKRLFSSLVRELILHGKIITSKAKAKAVQPLVEKLVTRAKKGTDVDRRLILKTVSHGDVVNILFRDAKDRFSQRISGFTRIIKMGNIRSDGSEEVLLSFVDEAIKREPVVYEKTQGIENREGEKIEIKKESKSDKKKPKKSTKIKNITKK